jgi:hypothetical protein
LEVLDLRDLATNRVNKRSMSLSFEAVLAVDGSTAA